MDINTVSTFINSVGFPIAACCVIAWLSYKQSENHKQETEELSKALNENTQVISNLKQMLNDILTIYGLYDGGDKTE